jgi:hypothetical protein
MVKGPEGSDSRKIVYSRPLATKQRRCSHRRGEMTQAYVHKTQKSALKLLYGQSHCDCFSYSARGSGDRDRVPPELFRDSRYLRCR